MKNNWLLLAATIALVVMLGMLPAYHFISESLPNDNYFIFLHWNNTTGQKDVLRFGSTFQYLSYINEHTPTNAIIIMPPDSVLLKNNGKIKLMKEITEKQWASYFVYPRKLVYEKEKSTNPLYENATYVAIVNGWGYDKLQYTLTDKPENYVAPLKF